MSNLIHLSDSRKEKEFEFYKFKQCNCGDLHGRIETEAWQICPKSNLKKKCLCCDLCKAKCFQKLYLNKPNPKMKKEFIAFIDSMLIIRMKGQSHISNEWLEKNYLRTLDKKGLTDTEKEMEVMKEVGINGWECICLYRLKRNLD